MLIALLLLAAQAQDYRLPVSDADLPYLYPTAYKDHGGVDWACGDLFYAGHQGSDFGVGSWEGMDAGRTAVAAAAGVVIEAHDGEDDRCTTGDCTDEVYGNHVRLRHADGKETVYGHLKRGSVAVALDEAVTCGTPLGQVGSSGWSTGPHLHFGVFDPVAGRFVDPFWGECDGAPSYWTDQGEYQGLPGTTCEDPPACAPVATLTCGATYTGATTGTGSAHAFWGTCADFTGYTGGEVALQLDVPPGEVSAAVTGLQADLDLFHLASSQCAALDCLAASTSGSTTDEALTWTADGAPTLLVLDGYQGAGSAFTVTVSCVSTPIDTAAQTVDDTPSEAPVVTAPAHECGCSHGPPSPWLLLGMLALPRARRRPL